MAECDQPAARQGRSSTKAAVPSIALTSIALLCSVLLITPLPSPVQAAEHQTQSPVQFVTQHFPPFSYLEQGQVAGPARALIDLVCQQMGITCQHQLLPWGRAQRLVQKGELDGLYLIGWNPERSKDLYFSVPLLSTEYGFFVRGDDPLHQTSVEALSGYRVAVLGVSNTLNSLKTLQQSSAALLHPAVSEAAASAPKTGSEDSPLPFEIIEVTDSETAFRLLNAERVDAVYSNRAVGQALIRQLQQKDVHYAISHRRLAYYVGFNREQISLEWLQQFNRHIEQLQQQDKLAPILQSYGLE
ncbi:MAG: transporter substrate-binding domain-containing protein [Motiliproteus sp.]